LGFPANPIITAISVAASEALDLDVVRLGLPERELVSADGYLYGVAQRGDLPDVDLAALGDAHVHDVALDGALAADLDHLDGRAD
jgi:hypothetical protein